MAADDVIVNAKNISAGCARTGTRRCRAARTALKALSKRAIHYAEGKEGYFVANCPMVEGGEGDWVQTSQKINNPYFGKSMLSCGSVK